MMHLIDTYLKYSSPVKVRSVTNLMDVAGVPVNNSNLRKVGIYIRKKGYLVSVIERKPKGEPRYREYNLEYK